MTNIKKAYVELVELLQANSNKKVGSILDEVMQLCAAKSGGGSGMSTVLKDEEGNTIAVFCYYHKKWEFVAGVEYGVKTSTSSGLNTMCKEGVSQWTKQQRLAKQAENALLDQLAAGTLAVDELESARAAISEEKQQVVARADEHGFDTLEEAEQEAANIAAK